MRYSHTIKAQERRLRGFAHVDWVLAMTTILRARAISHFRWFCAGDLQSTKMFEAIQQIARNTPSIKYWLPTQQRNYIQTNDLLDNLTVRVSNVFINSKPDTRYPHVSIVSTVPTDVGYMCPATFTKDHKCGSCRACWDKTIPIIVYKKH